MFFRNAEKTKAGDDRRTALQAVKQYGEDTGLVTTVEQMLNDYETTT